MIRLFFLSLLAGVLFAGCSLDFPWHPQDKLTLLTWNVQNLFDDVDDGTEYPEFDPEKGWSRADFWSRCEALAKVIREAVPGGPDLLVLEEIESPRALEVLTDRFLGGQGYQYSLITPPEFPGMRTAILARWPILRAGVHYPEVPAAGSLRPILEAEFDLGGRRLVVLANHWKSRIPTPAATEGQRVASALVLAERFEALEARDDLPLVVAVGDFNTSVELSRSAPSKAFSGTTERTLIGNTVLFDPWETAGEPSGSYVYKGEWNRLDHILLSVASLRAGDWEAGGFFPVRYAPEPLAWSPRSRKGVSDHFPLVITLRRRA